MTIASGALNLLAFPQAWKQAGGTMLIRFLCLPKGSPLKPLANGVKSFAEAKLVFEARLISGLAAAPTSGAVTEKLKLDVKPPVTRKKELFDELARQIKIDDAKPQARPLPTFRKPVTASYRTLTGDRRLNDYLVDGDEYDCALHSAHGSQSETLPPAPPAKLRWGQVIALATRQPKLAAELGLIGEATITPTTDLRRGGWLHIGLHGTSDGANVPALRVVSHAARIPALTADRGLYAAVQFPVDDFNANLDDVFRDAERYDNGFARLVHAAQTEPGAIDGDAIRLGWDDEQVAEWLNRQGQSDNAAPMGTAGYRVDVRQPGRPWNSLQQIKSVGDLMLGTLNLKGYSGEGVVEVVPAQVATNRPTEFWMPPYFATWRGSSLVLTDKNLTSLHKRTNIPFKGDKDSLLTRDTVFVPVDDDTEPLRYGRKYEFRVRLADLTGGGPGRAATDPKPVAGDVPNYVAAATFRRRRPPGPVQVTSRPTKKDTKLTVLKPRLAYPDLYYTGLNLGFDDLVKEALEEEKTNPGVGLSKPDPDVSTLDVTVQVRNPAGDASEWLDSYTVSHPFPEAELTIGVEFVDTVSIIGFAKPADGAALRLPTARDVRLVLKAMGRPDPSLTYFASPEARVGPKVTVDLHPYAGTEPDLIPDRPDVTAFFFRQPPPDGSVPRPAERLAAELNLDRHDLTLAGRAKGRTVIGCSAKLRAALSPERSAITVSSDADVSQMWINAVKFRIKRDWTWRGLAEAGIEVHRQVQRGAGALSTPELVGVVTLPNALSPNAAAGVLPGAAVRASTEVLFFDAYDPKPAPGEFPADLRVRYILKPKYENGLPAAQKDTAEIRLPVTTPPAQLPKLLSAGIAFQDVKFDDLSLPRRASLWLEFDSPPMDPNDAFFVRPLVAAPDPVLTDVVIPEAQEPALPIDPEWVRMIRPGQAVDFSGANAMQSLPTRAKEGQSYLVPLPEGVDASSPELLNMYTYEIRVGHADSRWCTANGRWGAPLRVTGIKHPPPPLTCAAARIKEGVLVRAPYATPTLAGRHVRPREPRTQLWALLYARVQRADAAAWRNVLLDRAPLRPAGTSVTSVVSPPTYDPAILYGEGGFDVNRVGQRLRVAGLPGDTALNVVVVEVFREPDFADPVGDELGSVPFLRTSPLVAVPSAC